MHTWHFLQCLVRQSQTMSHTLHFTRGGLSSIKAVSSASSAMMDDASMRVNGWRRGVVSIQLHRVQKWRANPYETQETIVAIIALQFISGFVVINGARWATNNNPITKGMKQRQKVRAPWQACNQCRVSCLLSCPAITKYYKHYQQQTHTHKQISITLSGLVYYVQKRMRAECLAIDCYILVALSLALLMSATTLSIALFRLKLSIPWFLVLLVKQNQFTKGNSACSFCGFGGWVWFVQFLVYSSLMIAWRIAQRYSFNCCYLRDCCISFLDAIYWHQY